MYKILSGFLLILFLLTAGIGGYKVWRSAKENEKLSNALAQSKKMEQETKSAYSIVAQKLSDLEVANKELRNKIDGRDEDVAAIGQANLRLKDQLFKIKNAKQTPVDENGLPIAGAVPCEETRWRVDFSEQDLWKEEGWCWTNPPAAEVHVSWLRPLQLSFVLTKKSNQYRLYLDSNSPDVIAVESLSLKVDPSVFEKSWYQKIMFSTDLGWSGTNPTVAARGTFDIGSFTTGPFIMLFNGKDGLERSVGLSFGYRPF